LFLTLEAIRERIQRQYKTPVGKQSACSVRLSKPAHARLQTLCENNGWGTSQVIRALLDIAWREVSGEGIDTPI
jgi:hypothetical protein